MLRALGAVFLLMLAGCGGEGAAASSNAPAKAEADVVGTCRTAVLAKLAKPSTASFPGGDAAPLPGGPDTWGVSIQVDFQNSAGTPVRSGYSCTVVGRPGSYRVTEVLSLMTLTEVQGCCVAKVPA